MHDRSLVGYTAEEIHHDGDDRDDGKDPSRIHSLCRSDSPTTCGRRTCLEEIRALVRRGANEGDMRRSEGILVAKEGDDG